MAKALAESDTSDVLAKIDVPTLLPWGEGDRRWPLGVAERFAASEARHLSVTRSTTTASETAAVDRV